MSGMEPEASDFLKRIVLSISLGLVWLILNMTIGIYLGWLFVKGRVGIGNIIYYCFFAGSLLLLIRFYIRTWRKKFPHG